MELRKLQIERKTYGSNVGKLEGRLFYGSHHEASVELPLDDDLSRRILSIVADELVAASQAVAQTLRADIIDNALPAPDREAV